MALRAARTRSTARRASARRGPAQRTASRIEEVEAELAELRKRHRAEYRADEDLRLRIALQREQRCDRVRRVGPRNDSVTPATRRARAGRAGARAGAARRRRPRARRAGRRRRAHRADLVAGGGRTLVVGSDVAPGQAVVTVTPPDGFPHRARVPEADLAPVGSGARRRRPRGVPGHPRHRRVTRVVEAAAGAAPARPGSVGGAAFVAEVALDDAGGPRAARRAHRDGVLTDLAFAERFEVRLEVDEIDVVLVEVGQQVSIELDALRGQPLTGTIVALATTPERSATGATVYRARVRLDAPGDAPPLRGGLTGTGDVEVQRLDAPLTVPSTALRRTGAARSFSSCAAVSPSRCRCACSRSARLRAAVEGDLRAGEQVITLGIERIEDGAPVVVR
jgi:hypothetical protein